MMLHWYDRFRSRDYKRRHYDPWHKPSEVTANHPWGKSSRSINRREQYWCDHPEEIRFIRDGLIARDVQ